ncbi:hypothetical protein Tco_0864238 [Tanacetum coccineum]
MEKPTSDTDRSNSRENETINECDDAHNEGESSANRQNTSEHGTYTGVSGKGITTDNPQRMQDASNDMIRRRCNSGEERQYHRDQMKSYMERQIVWESRKEDLTLQILKKPALVYQSFYGHNNLTSKRKLKTRDDPEDVYFEKRIVDVIRVQYDQCYRQENIEEIIVKRADGEYKSFTESYYKYLHKNDIEDMYLMCINGKVKNYQENGLLKSLNVFIRSCVIWERAHDYQLGLEIGLIYDNNKKEKRYMNIDEIPKFCDATLKRVFEKVKNINLDVKHGYADPTLSKDDA